MLEDASVLVVSGDVKQRMIICTNLEKYGITKIKIGNDGKEALEMIGEDHPDIVILDAVLARVDTYYVIKDAVLDPQNEFPPEFIVFSSSCDHSVFKDFYELGVKNCVALPIDFLHFKERLVRLMSERESDRDNKKDNGVIIDLETQVTEIIHQLGIPAHLKGYNYLRACIMMVVENNELLNAITKELYPGVAKMYSTTAPRVERTIRRAVEIAWERGNIEVLNDYFGYTIHSSRGRPTNSEFIALIADRIRLSNKKNETLNRK